MADYAQNKEWSMIDCYVHFEKKIPIGSYDGCWTFYAFIEI